MGGVYEEPPKPVVSSQRILQKVLLVIRPKTLLRVCFLILFFTTPAIIIPTISHIKLASAVGVLEEVYLTPTSAGDDANDGETAGTAVRTFERAKELLAPGGTIWLGASIVIGPKSDVVLSLEGPNGEIGTLKRRGGTDFVTTNGAHMIDMTAASVTTRSTLTLENIIIDGNKENYSAASAIIYARGKNDIIINEGAVLQNNKKTSTNGAAIYISGGELTMNGGVIQGIEASGSGAVYVYNGSVFNMNGGVIQNNTTTATGIVTINGSTFNLNKGTIQDNTSTSTNGVIYVYNNSNFYVGDPAYVVDDVSSQPNDEIVIQGNKGATNGGAIALNCSGAAGTCPTTGSTMTMWAGTIRNNNTTNGSSSTYFGGAGVYNRASTFYMYGGLFSGNRNLNSAVCGGAIYNTSIQYTELYLLGGTIDSTNTSNNCGDAVYHSSENSSDALLHIGGTEILSGIHLAAGMSTVIVDGLTSPILITVSDPSDGRVIAVGGDGYGPTAADAANILISTAGPYQYVTINELGEIVLTDEQPDYRGMNIYLDGVNGRDNYAGFSPGTAVRTFNAARERLMNGGTIHIVGTVTVVNAQAWELPTAVYGDATVRRYAGTLGGSALTDPLIEITSTGNLSLTNVVMSGGGMNVSPIIENGGVLSVAGRVVVGTDDSDGGIYLAAGKFLSLTGVPSEGSRFNIENVAESVITGRIVGTQPTAATSAVASYFHYSPAGARVIPSGNNYVLDGAITATSEGITNVITGVPIENAKIIYNLTDGEFAATINPDDFAVSGLPTGLSAGTAVRASDTTVEIPITGTPIVVSDVPIYINLPVTIPAANIKDATDDKPVTGTLSVYPIKYVGAEVTVPTLVAGSLGPGTFAVISSISGANPGAQVLEYAIGSSDNLNPSDLIWSSSGIFTHLTPETTYYAYARAAKTVSYYAGAAQVSIAITTPNSAALAVSLTPVAFPLNPGEENSGYSTISVTTDNPTGYSVSYHAETSSLSCPEAASSFSAISSTGNLSPNTWGWNTGTYSLNPSQPASWRVIPTTNIGVANVSAPSENGGSDPDRHLLWFGAKAGWDKPSCVYRATIVITVLPK